MPVVVEVHSLVGDGFFNMAVLVVNLVMLVVTLLVVAVVLED